MLMAGASFLSSASIAGRSNFDQRTTVWLGVRNAMVPLRSSALLTVFTASPPAVVQPAVSNSAHAPMPASILAFFMVELLVSVIDPAAAVGDGCVAAPKAPVPRE